MKNTILFTLILVLAYVWLPTGMTDIYIIPLIISKIGKEAYFVVSIFLIAFIWNNIEGKGIKGKFVAIKKEIL